MTDAIASAAKLLAEPARAAMLLALMSGKSLPAGELAAAARVSPQTASEHLARLVGGRFVVVHPQGRHRYYRLASTEIAAVVESLLVLGNSARPAEGENTLPTLGTLQHARTCYSHLAGWLGVRVADALQERDYLRREAGHAFQLTGAGKDWFAGLGVPKSLLPLSADPKIARQCLDWTQRRPHLAGRLGVSMYQRFLASKWIVPVKGSRTVRLTLEGRLGLQEQLGVVAG